jgi:hypothetical protein
LKDAVKCESIVVSSLQHKALLTSFRMNLDSKRGQGYWKMNTHILETDKTTHELLNKLLSNFLDQNTISRGRILFEAWENVKAEIADVSKTRSKLLAKEKRRRKTYFSNEIEHLRRKIAIYGHSEFLSKELKSWLDKLKFFEQDEIKNRLHTTHYQNLFYDRYSLQGAKQAQISSASDRNMSSLKTATGIELSEPVEILNELEKQFSILFKKKNVSGLDYFFNELIPENIFENLINNSIGSNIICEDEVDEAIKALKTHKTPGLDGIPAEFYKTFHIHFRKILAKMYNECFRLGSLASSMYEGVITLIYKGKGDRSLRSNWRPITLLNTDYKILAKILFNRLKPFTPKLVHPNQTCAIPGRNIQDGILLLYSIIVETFEKKENGFFDQLENY